jgi:phosphopantetheinyl transferase
MTKSYLFLYHNQNIYLQDLPSAITSHCFKYHDEKQRNISLSNYSHLKDKLKELYHLDIANLTFSRNGKPLIEGVNISLAHNKNLYGFVLSTQNVGLDIETKLLDNHQERMAKLLLNEEEKNAYELQDDKMHFLTLKWCQKEALGKMKGCGLEHEIFSLSISCDLHFIYENNYIVVVSETKLDDLVINVDF